MKTIMLGVLILLTFTGLSPWEPVLQQFLQGFRQQLPQIIAGLWPPAADAEFPRISAPGQERQITTQLRARLQALEDSGSLKNAHVKVQSVRFVSNGTPFGKETKEQEGYYAATINYDVVSPLDLESGVAVLAAACSSGVAQITLSDGFSVTKTFKCPSQRR